MVQSHVVREAIKAYSYVLLWMSVSIAVILFNKWLLAFAGFPFPIALTLWHMIVCSSVGVLCVRVLKTTKSFNMSVEEYVTRVMPIGVLYAASLWLSNTSYLYLAVSFIPMTKSLMPGLVYFSGCLVGTERFSLSYTANMGLIAGGVVVCAFGEVNLVVRGLIIQLVALGFEATRLTLVQVLINSKGYKMDPFQSLYYVSPACMVCLVVPFFIMEYAGVRHLLQSDWVFRPAVLLANAMTAVVLNLAVFLLIGKTSALTMNIAGVIKDWLLIYSSYSIFHAPVTLLNLAGYIFCCSGVGIYNYLKMVEMRAATAAKGHRDADAQHGRTKDDVMSEMHKLQDELSALDKRLNKN